MLKIIVFHKLHMVSQNHWKVNVEVNVMHSYCLFSSRLTEHIQPAASLRARETLDEAQPMSEEVMGLITVSMTSIHDLRQWITNPPENNQR